MITKVMFLKNAICEEKMDICDNLIDLRIALTTQCDGFSSVNSNKNLLLSNRLKALYLLEQKDLTPIELIESLGMAKSNLANMSKVMIGDGVIDSYKTLGNSRNVFYRITEKGKNELKEYKSSLCEQFCSKYKDRIAELNSYSEKILEILRGE